MQRAEAPVAALDAPLTERRLTGVIPIFRAAARAASAVEPKLLLPTSENGIIAGSLAAGDERSPASTSVAEMVSLSSPSQAKAQRADSISSMNSAAQAAAGEDDDESDITDKPTLPARVAKPLLGVTALADSSVNIRVVIKTTPGNQWAVGRAYNRLVKIYFDKAGIEIPFPHTTLYFGEDRDGNAPPANVRMLGDERVVDTQKDGTSSDRSE